jgi:SAM-dependent methyltransferase
MDGKERYDLQWKALNREVRGLELFQEPIGEPGTHPESFIDHECAFAADHIKRTQPQNILDIGSYRHFILGLLAHYPVTTIDVRPRRPVGRDESPFTCDAKKMPFPDDHFDLVLSLCALEHFGLGRYGDEFDPGADQKAFGEMIRVLRPGGSLIFSTTVTRAKPSVVFNAHRIYSHPMLQGFCAVLTCLEEKFYSHQKRDFCPLEEITDKPRGWDVYLGCWRKETGFRDRKGPEILPRV